MGAADQPSDQAARSAVAKASWRILPLFFLAYGISYMDRINISFASLQMNQELKFSASVYGLGGGLFFVTYALFEVPSNLVLVRVGARRWIARIMLTWGLIATGMMFVRTPAEFYAMRLLLGMAEAGFFPGVIYHLTQWFPAEHRGRALARFYISAPLSTAVMGALAGGLLGLDGRGNLAGWQWLFLIEGLPAVALGFIVLVALPDTPAKAAWLSKPERDWLMSRLSAERAVTASSEHHSLFRVLLEPTVWMLGLCDVCIMGAGYAFALSTPAVLKDATHWTTGQVGLLLSATGVAAAIAMLANGEHSDRHRERYVHSAIPLAVMAAAFLAMGLSKSPWVVVSAYVVSYMSNCAAQAAFWLIPGERLGGRAAAIGLAAIGSIGMLGAFVGPYAWGIARDRTGDYRFGLLSLAIPYASAALILLALRHRARQSACPKANEAFG